MPDYPQYVRDLVKAWAAGDDHAGYVLRFLSGATPEEREAMLRDAQKLAERERPDR